MINDQSTEYDEVEMPESFLQNSIFEGNNVNSFDLFILISLDFDPHDSIAVELSYSREYLKYDYSENDRIYYNYMYVISTGLLWDHTIDKAEFIFRVSDELADGINWRYESTHEKGFFVATATFQDWDIAEFRYDDIFISWYKLKEPGSFPEPEIAGMDLLLIAGLVTFIVMIAFSIWLIVWKREKQKGSDPKPPITP
jgi:hypothetical protein